MPEATGEAASAEAAKYCQHCGAGLNGDPAYCPECGTNIARDATPDSTNRVDSGAGTAYLKGLAGCWALWVIGYPDMTSSSPGILAITGGLALLASLPMLWFDARDAMRAGEIKGNHPTLIVILVLVLWAVLLPVYIGWRFYKLRAGAESGSEQQQDEERDTDELEPE